MIGDIFLFVFALCGAGVLLFGTVYVVITLSDLECDYLNVYQGCSKLNYCVVPELIGQGFVTVLLLLEFHWVLFLLNLPVTSWQLYSWLTIPKGNYGVYDPTEIHNRGNLKKHMKNAMIKLAFYLIFFFVYLYCMIIALLVEPPSKAAEREGQLEQNIPGHGLSGTPLF